MLATGHVWGTNVGFLNDPSEMRYAARLIRSVLAEEVKLLQAEPQSMEEEKANWVRKFTASYADSISTGQTTWTESTKTFEDQGDGATCFCTKGDCSAVARLGNRWRLALASARGTSVHKNWERWVCSLATSDLQTEGAARDRSP
jgi:hypothetical protein